MITITGRTFQHRDALKAFGAHWDQRCGWWTLDSASGIILAALRTLPGVIVTDTRPPGLRDRLTPNPFAAPRRRPTQIFGDDERFVGYFADPNPTAHFGFSSLAAFADHVEPLEPPVHRDRNCRAWSTDDKSREWTGTADMAEALNLARTGWTDGLGITDMLTVDAATRKRRRHDVVGSSVNVGRMLAGDPRCMIRRTPQPAHKIIRLFIETVMWRGIGASVAIFRALIVAGMVDLLEREGYRCEVIAITSSRHMSIDRFKSFLTVALKEANESLNLLDITFALGHPSFLRRLYHAAEACVPECCLDEDDFSLIGEAFDEDHPPGRNEFYIPQLQPDQVRQLTADPMSILPLIQPENLPITITGVH